MISKKLVVERLEMLESVIEKAGQVLLTTEISLGPEEYKKDAEKFGKMDLFNQHLIRISEKIQYIGDLITGKEKLAKDVERVFIITTMKDANRLWKLHHKVITGEIREIELIEFEDTMTEYLDTGSKINAIKYYREWIKNYTGNECSLREAKDKVDAFASSRKEGILL